MKTVVSGATGFVGTALMRQLEHSGIALSLRGDPSTWASALQGAGAVVHLAARVHIMNDTANDPLLACRQVNTDLTLRFAQEAAQAGVKRFVFLSSVKVMGESSLPGRPLTEADPPAPLDPYGVSKWEAEQGLLALASDTGMEVVIVRPPLVYGPGVKANFARLMKAVRLGVPLPLGSVHNLRSLVALDNLVDFIALCTHHPAAANQAFLVSDGEDVSTTQLLRHMADACGVRSRLIPFPVALLKLLGRFTGKADEVDRLCGNLQIDTAKARQLLGWQPPLTLRQGLRAAST